MMEIINMTAEEKLSILVNHFMTEMENYIEEHWDISYVEEMDSDEAEVYLGYSVRDLSKEEIHEAVSDIQKAYYVEGEADEEELLDMFLKLADV